MKTKVSPRQALSFVVPVFIFFLFAAFQNTLADKQDQEKKSIEQIEQDTAQANEWIKVAKIFVDSARYDSALVYYQKAEALYKPYIQNQSNKDTSVFEQYIILNNNIGKNYIDITDFDKSLEVLLNNYKRATTYFGENHLLVAKVCNRLSEVYNNLEDLNQAFENIQKALSIIPQTSGSNHLDLVETYTNLGVYYLNQGDFEKSLDSFQKALNVQLENLGKTDPSIGLTYINIGDIYKNLGDYENADAASNKALSILLKTYGEDNLNVANSYELIANIQGRKGDYERSLKNHFKALNIMKNKLGDTHLDVSGIYNNIAVVYFRRDEFDMAEKYYQKSLGIRLKELGDKHPKVATVFGNLAVSYGMQLNHEKALEYYNKSLVIRLQQGKNHPSLGRLYNNMGKTYGYQGTYEKALDFFEKAQRILQEKYGENHIYVAIVFLNFSQIYSLTGKYEKALKYNDNALSIYSSKLSNTHKNVGNCLRNKGNIYLNQGIYDVAVEYFKKAANIYQQALNEKHIRVGEVYASIGHTYYRQKDYEKALEYYGNALNILEENGKECSCLSSIYNDLGLIYFNQNKHIEALEFMQKAIQDNVVDFEDNDIFQNPSLLNRIILKQKLTAELKVKATILLDFYLKKSNDLKHLQLAIDTYHLADGFIDESRRENTRIREKKAFLKGSTQIYEGGIKATQEKYKRTQKEDVLISSFYFFEKNRAVILLEDLKANNAKHFAQLPAKLLEKELDIEINLAYYEKKLYHELVKKEKADSSKLTLWKNKVFDYKQSYDSLITHLESNFPDYYRLKYDINTVDVKEVQNEILQSNQALLEYFVGDSSIYIAIITKNKFDVQEIKKDFPLEDWVKTMQQNLFSYHLSNKMSEKEYQANADSLIKVSHRLYQKIFEPILAKHQLPEQLIIVPDGLLGYIPFEVLVTSRPEKNTNYGSHDYLIQDFQVSYAYSATLLKEMQDKQHRKTLGNLLAFAPSFSTGKNLIAENRSIEDIRLGLSPLKYNIPEVNAIKQLVGGKVYEGLEATKEIFMQAANQYKIIHLATHGKANDNVGDYSFLAFADVPDSVENELLYTRDLYNLRLNADMVVLSACETGIGELQRGEGIVSLARGFSYAGAKSIITTLWSINDKATGELMESFYSFIKEGKTKDAALRQAKLDYLQSHPNEEVHPFYWGAFIAIGDMEAVPNSGFPQWLWLLLPVAIIILLIYFIRFKQA